MKGCLSCSAHLVGKLSLMKKSICCVRERILNRWYEDFVLMSNAHQEHCCLCGLSATRKKHKGGVIENLCFVHIWNGCFTPVCLSCLPVATYLLQILGDPITEYLRYSWLDDILPLDENPKFPNRFQKKAA